MDQQLRNILEESGQVNFGFAGAGFGYLMSNEAVSTLSDMSGQKTWVQEGDQISYTAFKALGISPVSMPLTDVLTGLQTELLDSAAVSPVGAGGTAIAYQAELHHGPASFLCLRNPDH